MGSWVRRQNWSSAAGGRLLRVFRPGLRAGPPRAVREDPGGGYTRMGVLLSDGSCVAVGVGKLHVWLSLFLDSVVLSLSTRIIIFLYKEQCFLHVAIMTLKIEMNLVVPFLGTFMFSSVCFYKKVLI